MKIRPYIVFVLDREIEDFGSDQRSSWGPLTAKVANTEVLELDIRPEEADYKTDNYWFNLPGVACKVLLSGKGKNIETSSYEDVLKALLEKVGGLAKLKKKKIEPVIDFWWIIHKEINLTKKEYKIIRKKIRSTILSFLSAFEIQTYFVFAGDVGKSNRQFTSTKERMKSTAFDYLKIELTDRYGLASILLHDNNLHTFHGGNCFNHSKNRLHNYAIDIIMSIEKANISLSDLSWKYSYTQGEKKFFAVSTADIFPRPKIDENDKELIINDNVIKFIQQLKFDFSKRMQSLRWKEDITHSKNLGEIVREINSIMTKDYKNDNSLFLTNLKGVSIFEKENVKHLDAHIFIEFVLSTLSQFFLLLEQSRNPDGSFSIQEDIDEDVEDLFDIGFGEDVEPKEVEEGTEELEYFDNVEKDEEVEVKEEREWGDNEEEDVEKVITDISTDPLDGENIETGEKSVEENNKETILKLFKQSWTQTYEILFDHKNQRSLIERFLWGTSNPDEKNFRDSMILKKWKTENLNRLMPKSEWLAGEVELSSSKVRNFLDQTKYLAKNLSRADTNKGDEVEMVKQLYSKLLFFEIFKQNHFLSLLILNDSKLLVDELIRLVDFDFELSMKELDTNILLDDMVGFANTISFKQTNGKGYKQFYDALVQKLYSHIKKLLEKDTPTRVNEDFDVLSPFYSLNDQLKDSIAKINLMIFNNPKSNPKEIKRIYREKFNCEVVFVEEFPFEDFKLSIYGPWEIH